VALSPDGSRLAYVATQGGTQQIYLRAMDSLKSKPISGTEGAVNPFFSPDSQWVGFFASEKLKKVSVSGGAVVALCDAVNAGGASRSRQGMIAFAPSNVSVLQQVSEGGGTLQPLTRMEKGETGHRWPDFLPGGRAVLFAGGPSGMSFSNAQVGVQSVGTGERRNLIQAGTQPRYSPSGHLIYAQGGSLMAVPFDSQRLQVTGTAVPVAEGILQSTANGDAQFSLSATGSLDYISGAFSRPKTNWCGSIATGKNSPWLLQRTPYLAPRLSPDSRRVAVSSVEQDSQVWLYDLSRKTLTRLS
jgi:Tol biopolymer transport system component